MLKFFTSNKHTPRWIVLLIDIMISVMSIVFAFLLRFNFDLTNDYFDTIWQVIIFVFIVRLTFFLLTRSYAGIIRYTGTKDAIKIILVITYTNLTYIAANYLVFFLLKEKYIIPFSVIFIDFFVSIFLLTSFRFFVKSVYYEANNFFKEEQKVVIVGISENAITTKRVLMRDPEIKYTVEAFVDPFGTAKKKQIDGINFKKISDLESIFNKQDIYELIFSDKNIQKQTRIITSEFYRPTSVWSCRTS